MFQIRVIEGEEEKMPKLKTHKGAAKRFKLTATGKIKRRKSGLRHILTSKSPSNKNALGKTAYVDKTNAPAIKKLLVAG